MIAVVSYNRLNLCRELNKSSQQYKKSLLVFDTMFHPKCQESVLPSDPVYKRLLSFKKTINNVIIFAGKKSSGSLEIIDLFCKDYLLYKLSFVLCNHDLQEKIDRLSWNNVDFRRVICFKDNEHIDLRPCDEEVVLAGLATKKILKY